MVEALRSLRSARNDMSIVCHCEEHNDEAISIRTANLSRVFYRGIACLYPNDIVGHECLYCGSVVWYRRNGRPECSQIDLFPFDLCHKFSAVIRNINTFNLRCPCICELYLMRGFVVVDDLDV